MRIARIVVYRVALPYKPVSSRWRDRVGPQALDSIIVAVETDEGITGYGETCPVGAIYLPAFAETARAAIAEMAPALLNKDPRELGRINDLMDTTVLGHPHAKSAIDIACWDILGQATGLPLYLLLGGRYAPTVPLVVAIPFGTPRAMADAIKQRREQGFRVFQMKVGSGAVEDIARIRAAAKDIREGERLIVDANRSWTNDDALRVFQAIGDVDCLIEQPCATYEACVAVRRQSRQPFLLDEVIDDIDDLLRALSDGIIDGLVIKLAHAGGLTRAVPMRDICVRRGLRMRIEDTAGSEFVLAATAHLALSTPPAYLLGAYPFVNDGVSTADGAPKIKDGCLTVSDKPGLGLTPNHATLGKPILTVS
jgi:cis-L-3-hydroxyproline dehydratase